MGNEMIEWGVEDLPATGLSAVSQSAQALRAALFEKERKELELKLINERIRRIEFEELPAALSELGVEKITLEGGDVVSVRDEVSASIAEADMPAALEWLRKTNNDSIIKRAVLISFGKGEDKAAAECVEALGKRFPDNELVDKETINHQTLKAFVRERVEVEKIVHPETGGPILAPEFLLPRLVFGVWEGKRATVKRAKVKTDKLI